MHAMAMNEKAMMALLTLHRWWSVSSLAAATVGGAKYDPVMQLP